MVRAPPVFPLDRSAAASDVYKRQVIVLVVVAIAIAVGVWVILDAYGDAIWDFIVILFWGALVLSAFVGLVSWVMGGS